MSFVVPNFKAKEQFSQRLRANELSWCSARCGKSVQYVFKVKGKLSISIQMSHEESDYVYCVYIYYVDIL